MKEKLFLILIVLSGLILPQEQKYFDAPFGGGGGYSPAWYVHNLDALNKELTAVGIPELGKSGIFSSGGGGFVYIGFVTNLRIGGMGFGGGTSSKISSGGLNREARYSFGGGGFTVEYTLPFIKRMGVSLGAVIGAASQQIEIYKNSGSFSWGDLWTGEQTNNNTANYNRVLANNYWILSPTLNVEIPFYRFFVFRIGAGYNFSLGNGWTVENNKDIQGVPSGLNGDGFYIQSGIFAGFFSF